MPGGGGKGRSGSQARRQRAKGHPQGTPETITMMNVWGLVQAQKKGPTEFRAGVHKLSQLCTLKCSACHTTTLVNSVAVFLDKRMNFCLLCIPCYRGKEHTVAVTEKKAEQSGPAPPSKTLASQGGNSNSKWKDPVATVAKKRVQRLAKKDKQTPTQKMEEAAKGRKKKRSGKKRSAVKGTSTPDVQGVERRMATAMLSTREKRKAAINAKRMQPSTTSSGGGDSSMAP